VKENAKSDVKGSEKQNRATALKTVTVAGSAEIAADTTLAVAASTIPVRLGTHQSLLASVKDPVPLELLSVSCNEAPPSSSATYGTPSGEVVAVLHRKEAMQTPPRARTALRPALSSGSKRPLPNNSCSRFWAWICCQPMARQHVRSMSDSNRREHNRGCCSRRVHQLAEVRLMHRSIGSILYALSSYDQVRAVLPVGLRTFLLRLCS
jgi:hypothetical protein